MVLYSLKDLTLIRRPTFVGIPNKLPILALPYTIAPHFEISTNGKYQIHVVLAMACGHGNYKEQPGQCNSKGCQNGQFGLMEEVKHIFL